MTTAKELVYSDPPPREDGLCFVCEGEQLPLGREHRDPFCGRDCAGVWHSPKARAAKAWVGMRLLGVTPP